MSNNFLEIKLASPDRILKWSSGEIKKSETINYRTLRPESDGLFCEKIFGPVKNFHCASGCGEYDKPKDAGTVCEKCGVEVSSSKVRRERMGHIELATPIVHYWYFKTQSFIPLLLDLKNKEVESVIYCKNYIVVDPGDTPLEKKQLLNVKEYSEYFSEYGYEFKVEIGGKAIKTLLEEIDLEILSNELEVEIENTKTQKKKDLIKRLQLVEDFKKSGNRPEWMVLDRLPVLPADLRPLVQLDGGRFATSDLNELYRRIINRNNRLIRLEELNAPSIIKLNEQRMLQESLDSLIDNEKRKHSIKGPGNRELKSLSSYLKGKTGRFRQNLLGKRVDYSGRSVITVGPKLKLHQCGIPREMALELFKPFVMNQMVNLGYVETFKQAKKNIENRNEAMWDVLEKIVKHHPVLLNRAPTLHKLSIRAFEPIIIEGKAITLHPLVCPGFNADFDGDTMSVHIPISREAQAEARVLMLATKNLLHPQNGKSSVTPSQDMILGCAYLSLEKQGAIGEGSFFSNFEEVMKALENGFLSLHSKIVVGARNNKKIQHKYLVTTPGKIIFNEGFPKKIPFVNDGVVSFDRVEGTFDDIGEAKKYVYEKSNNIFDKGFLQEFISQVFNEIGEDETIILLDNVKEKGFDYATKAGITIALSDVHIPKTKSKLIVGSEKLVLEIEELYQYGRLTLEDRHDSVIKIWSKVSEEIAKDSIKLLESFDFNPIQLMISSGARGSAGQYRQLAGMRGLMADPSGRTIERPVKTSFKEGLDQFDYFISSHGSRKGMADTAIKTADSGYLTRKMVDVAHDVVVNEEDCSTEKYTVVKELKGDFPTINLEERILGRYLAQDLLSKGKVAYKKDSLINEKMAKEISKDFEEVPIRSLLVCETERGVCRKCYGYDLSNNKLVEKGEAVGVIAAQSIGEPGTQLTMRTFHTGGVASSGGDITQGLPRIIELTEARKKVKGEALLSEVEGNVIDIVEKGRLKDIKIMTVEKEEKVYKQINSMVRVEIGDKVEIGQQLTNGSVNAHTLLNLRGIEEVQKYLIQEIQKVYRKQGVKINDKHIEVIARQMTKRVYIKDTGDSDLLLGDLVERSLVERTNKKLRKEGKKEIEVFDAVLGITGASLSNDSFLSAASFQETPKVLTEAAVKGKRDYIIGLKEAVILGRNIPAGTGFFEYLQK